MKRLLLTAMLLVAPMLAQAQQVQLTWPPSYSQSSAITSGTSYAPARGIGFVLTAAGTITVTLLDGSTIAIPVTGTGTWQTLPYATTKIVLSGGAAGTFYALN
jgi:type 1 fimbria pilin